MTIQRYEQAGPIAISHEMDLRDLGQILAASGYFQESKQAAQAIVKVLAGAELGFPPIASMNGIHIINGKTSMSANMMAAAIKRSGRYNYRVAKLDEQGAEIVFLEKSGGDWHEIGRSLFSLADANKAGLTTGKNGHMWAKWFRNMAFARAMSNGAKWYCPDVFGGMPVYTPEELDVQVDEDGQALQTALPTPQQAPTPARQAPALPAPQEASQSATEPAEEEVSEEERTRLAYLRGIQVIQEAEENLGFVIPPTHAAAQIQDMPLGELEALGKRTRARLNSRIEYLQKQIKLYEPDTQEPDMSEAKTRDVIIYAISVWERIQHYKSFEDDQTIST